MLPFDPTAMTPVCIVAVDSQNPSNNESVLYDVGRYEVRNMIMGIPGRWRRWSMAARSGR